LATNHSNFRLVVFDLDGTLVDSKRDLAEAVNALLVACGALPLPEDRIGRMIGEGAAVLVARAFAAAGIDPPPDALGRFLAIYDERLLDHTRAYEGIPDVLEALRLRAALSVLTNKPLAASRRILAGLDLARFFTEAAVIGGDGPFPRKPNPQGLLHLAAVAGAAPDETLLVGDSLIDWRTAREAATAVCVARYGFGFEGFPTDRLTPADCVIDHPRDLLSRL
jgi:phosphoglycolate phosphatase